MRASLSLFFVLTRSLTAVYSTRSLHDALPISSFLRRPLASPPCGSTRPGSRCLLVVLGPTTSCRTCYRLSGTTLPNAARSEEHTSELQSPCNLVCRLLLEKKKKQKKRDLAIIE